MSDWDWWSVKDAAGRLRHKLTSSINPRFIGKETPAEEIHGESVKAGDLSDDQGRKDLRLNEDPNSPFILSETNQTATLGESFGTEMVVKITDATGADRVLAVQLDKVTAADYLFTRRDGTEDSSDRFPEVINTANGVGGEITLATGGARLGIVSNVPWDNNQATDSGVITSDGSPPESITFIEDTGQSWSMEIEVYGR